VRGRAAILCRDRKVNQAEKNKKLEKYYKFEKEWLKRVSHDKND